MANPTIKFKRSAVASKRPSLTNLDLGELALNTYDGKLFTVQDTGGVGIATTVTLVNPWDEAYDGGQISYGGTVTTGDINVDDLRGDNIFITGVTTSIGGFILRNPNDDNYARNVKPPDYSDNTGTPTMDEDPISAGIYADGSASFSGIVTATGGFKGSLTGNVTGNLTGTADNANTLGGVTSSFLLNYNNFTNTPTIPTNNNELTNGAGYITASDSIANATFATNAGVATYADVAGIATYATIAGVATYATSSGIATLSGYATTAGISTVAQNLTGNPTIVVTDITASQIDINGISTFHNKVHLLDNKVLHLGGAEGTDGDLQIYHDTNNSYIKDAGTGALKILGGNTTIKNAADNKTSAAFNVATSVDLYYNNSQKFETTSDGINVTGHTETDTLNVSGLSTFQDDIYVDQIRRYSGNSTTTKIQLNSNQIRLFAGNGTTPKISLNGTVGINTNTIVTGVLTATSFVGDGSGLTNVGMDTSIINSTQIQSGIITATSQFYPPSLTTSERDAITFNAGAFIYNETEGKMQMYIGSTWKNLAFELDSYTTVGL